MTDQRNTIVAILLSVIVLIGWQYFIGVPQMEKQKAQQEAKEANEADPDAVFAVDVTGPIKAGQLEGPANAPVTIVKAFDFACPYCEKLNTPLHELVKEYNGKVRVVYMNLVVHPDTAQLAHQYSCAAAKQGKYVAWKDAFWQKGFYGRLDLRKIFGYHPEVCLSSSCEPIPLFPLVTAPPLLKH